MAVYDMDPENASSFLSSLEMEELFQQTFGPSLDHRGFQYAGKNLWIRDTGVGFKYLFYLYPFRPGADYYPHGALSFDFVPRIEAGKVRLRPGPKHTRIHLTVADYGIRKGQAMEINRNRQSARQRCQGVSEKAVPSITDALIRYQSLADALAKFERDKADKTHGFYCYPESALAYAFILSALGRIQDAKDELEKALQSNYFEEEIYPAIRALLLESTPLSPKPTD
jgi:tetratricopeptide (TPR) repeat protein